jgi:DNA-binding transcriptional LysR family regulator
MQMTLDIELLRTFQAVTRFQQFLAAATHLNRSPSAVSLHIRRLEDIAGGRLLERDNQTVSLTALGRRFAQQSAELLDVHDRILSALRMPSISGRVRLGISEEYAAALLHSLIGDLSSTYPQIELEVETGSSGRLDARLQSGQLDIAMLVEQIDMPVNPRTVRRFGTTEPVWVAAHGFQLPADKPLPLALHGTGCPYRAVAIETLERANRPWRMVVMSASASALETTICAGLAIGIVDRSRVSPQMRILSGEAELPALPLHAIKLVAAPGKSDAACEAMIELIGERFHL